VKTAVVLRGKNDVADSVRVATDLLSSGDDLFEDGSVQFSIEGRPAQDETAL
jgi:hypothetical protein